MTPQLSYTIWFSQRTGSTLLTTALAATGVAGQPEEWLETPEGEGLLAHYGAATPEALRQTLWARGTTSNGVFGAKVSFYEPHMTRVLALWRQLPNVPADATRSEVWARVFPNGRHIYMTRRNKVRQAISWWRAIRSETWHAPVGEGETAAGRVGDKDYDFAALRQLLDEAMLREAGIEAFFAEGGIVPLTLVYEDFARDYVGTLRRVLDYLGVALPAKMPAPAFRKIADEVAETWVQRFRDTLQEGWIHRGW